MLIMSVVACIGPEVGTPVTKQSMKLLRQALGAGNLDPAAPISSDSVVHEDRVADVNRVLSDGIALLRPDGLSGSGLHELLKVCARGIDVADFAHLESLAVRATGILVQRQGHLNFGQASACSGGGFLTVLHNLAGPNGEAGPLQVGETFHVIIGGREFKAEVLSLPPMLSGPGGLQRDGIVFLAQSATAVYSENPPARDFTDRGRLIGIGQKTLVGEATKQVPQRRPALEQTMVYQSRLRHGESRPGASGSPRLIVPLSAGGAHINTVHVGRVGADVVSAALAGGEGPHVLLRPVGSSSVALSRLVESVTLGEPTLLEAFIHKPGAMEGIDA